MVSNRHLLLQCENDVYFIVIGNSRQKLSYSYIRYGLDGLTSKEQEGARIVADNYIEQCHYLDCSTTKVVACARFHLYSNPLSLSYITACHLTCPDMRTSIRE